MSARHRKIIGWITGVLTGAVVPVAGVALTTWADVRGHERRLAEIEIDNRTLEEKIGKIAEDTAFIRGKLENK